MGDRKIAARQLASGTAGADSYGHTTTRHSSSIDNTRNAAGTSQRPPLPQTATPTQMNNAVLQSLLLYQNNQSQETKVGTGKGKEGRTAASSIASALLDDHDNDTVTRSGATSSSSGTAQTAMKPMPTLPDDLRALVQQQLDAAGSQRLLWHGEIWPEQTMHWQLEWQEQGGQQGGGAEEETPWQTSLRLTTPRLGSLEASLQLGAAGVRIVLGAADAASAQEMRMAAPELMSALEAAGLRLLGFSVRQAAEDVEKGAE